MQTDIILWIVSIVLLALTVYFLYRGCSCPKLEAFENASAAKKELTKDELSLFEDLKADKYSAKEIDDLVTKGVIDQQLVEKFLANIDSFEAEAEAEAEAEPDADAEAEKPKPTPKPKRAAAPRPKA
jgi:hypothetical protein